MLCNAVFNTSRTNDATRTLPRLSATLIGCASLWLALSFLRLPCDHPAAIRESPYNTATPTEVEAGSTHAAVVQRFAKLAKGETWDDSGGTPGAHARSTTSRSSTRIRGECHRQQHAAWGEQRRVSAALGDDGAAVGPMADAQQHGHPGRPRLPRP